MGKYDFLLFPIAIGVMWTLFSVFVEKGMKFFGITRGNTSWLVINVFFFTVLNQLADFNSMFTLLVVFGTPLGVNRYDISNSMRKGRWWWKTDK